MKLFISRVGIIGVILLSGLALASCQTQSPIHSAFVAPTTMKAMDPAVALTPSTPVLKLAGFARNVALNTNAAVLSALKKEPRRALPPSKVGVLSPEEEAELLKLYRDITNPIERFGITMALACGGGDATFEVFRNTLEHEFRGRTLSIQEEGAVLLTTRLLGLLAPRSDVAWEYLKSGCLPNHWAGIEKWTGPRIGTDSYLADYCTQGVGAVGTLEARAFLIQLTQQMNRKEALDLYGAVLSAAADLDISETQGRARFLDEIFMKHEHYDFFEQWLATENAKPWLEWRDRVKQAK